MKGEYEKGDVRQEFLMRRAALEKANKSEADNRIRMAILSEPEFVNAQYVAIFAASSDEPDLLPLVEANPSKIFLLPRYVKEKKCYEMAVVKNVTKDLTLGRYGILEPTPDAEVPSQEVLERGTFYLIPLVSVDMRGVRLGRGGGYYDRLLAKVQSPLWGVGYECQLSPEDLPEEKHDRRLDGIFTNTCKLTF